VGNVVLANYHMTENKYLETILNYGLLPQQGIRSQLIGDSKKALFYSKGYEGVIAMFFMMIERFIEYRGSIGDIHIETYRNFLAMADQKQSQNMEVSQVLKDAIYREEKIVEMVQSVRNAPDWKNFLGEGVCLKLVGICEEDKIFESSFYNSWTYFGIIPENISLIALKNLETGEILTSKYDVIHFMMSKIPLERMRVLLYDNDRKEQQRKSHLLWQIMEKYYMDHRNHLEYYSHNYELQEISLQSYFDKEKHKIIGK